MASFLNNTNDIILDAVLTDYGRQLLAKGDGSFNIVKFAFGDDEIDYALYNTGAVSPNQDTELMATPILEAITNNIASLQNKLLTIKQENILFLPILKLNTNTGVSNNIGAVSAQTAFDNGYIIAVDSTSNPSDTANASYKLTTDSAGVRNLVQGVISSLRAPAKRITVDQGLNSTKLRSEETLLDISPELYENEYNILIDSRFGTIVGLGDPLSVDDDYIATYSVTDGNTGFVNQISPTDQVSSINGTKGTRLQFTIEPTLNLKFSDVYFTTLGSTSTTLNTNTFKSLRTSVQIVGVKTGYSIDIPILFAK
jgi:hypothetical protein